MVAHHAVLVVNMLRVAEQTREDVEVKPEENDPDVLWDLAEAANKITRKNYQEVWHDTLQAREEILSRFNLGLLDLRQRAKGERLFWTIASRI
ncbi:MAG: arginine decarboxylase, partial [Planctomycetes bacterium]|nr:arginine decarboxylase [Planctomycetota bacterium]